MNIHFHVYRELIWTIKDFDVTNIYAIPGESVNRNTTFVKLICVAIKRINPFNKMTINWLLTSSVQWFVTFENQVHLQPNFRFSRNIYSECDGRRGSGWTAGTYSMGILATNTLTSKQAWVTVSIKIAGRYKFHYTTRSEPATSGSRFWTHNIHSPNWDTRQRYCRLGKHFYNHLPKSLVRNNLQLIVLAVEIGSDLSELFL